MRYKSKLKINIISKYIWIVWKINDEIIINMILKTFVTILVK